MNIQPLSDYDLLPIYVRVADDLRSRLGTEGFEIGSYLPGELDIAAQYDLSRGTIRRALGILEAEGLLSRQPGRGTLILPKSVGVMGTRPKVAVVWTMVRAMGLEMLSSLEDCLSSANCDMLFSSSKHDPEREAEILTGLLASDIDAVVLYSTGSPANNVLIQQLHEQGKQIVLLDRFVPGAMDNLSWVTSDNERGAYELTHHLLELGHERIGLFIRTPDDARINTLVEREQGYLRAMREVGLDPILMKKCGVADDLLSGTALGQDLIEFIVTRQPTAIFFHNDASAYRMHSVLNQYGIRVPQDVSIAGFDGLELFFDLLTFELTTVQQDFAALGHEVGELVISLMKNSGRRPKHISLPVKLRIGNTTAPPRREVESRPLNPHFPDSV